MSANALTPTARFRAVFSGEPSSRCFSPGRVNLIGEHIDYCGGDVLPMAIDRGTDCAYAANGSTLLRIHSMSFDETVELDLGALPAARGHWSDYGAGVAAALESARGVDIVVHGTIGGGGLSSSASFSMAIGYALLEAAGAAPETDAERLMLAQQCRAAENDFVGVSCGIMDQASIALGGIVRLDCDSLEFDRVEPGDMDTVWVVMDTRHPRTLAGSRYNERVGEIRSICDQCDVPGGMASLCRVVDPDSLQGPGGPFSGLDETLFRRLRHLATEQTRVTEAARALAAGDAATLGLLMNASHASLKGDYEVTGEALDVIVGISQGFDGVYGARMTGAGFGGCAIALVAREAVRAHADHVRTAFERETGVAPEVFTVTAALGVGLEA